MIRDARPEDAAAIGAIWNPVIRDTAITFWPTERTEAEIRAYGASEFEVQMPQYQVVLLGPQGKYMLPDMQGRAAEHGIPVDVINMMDYGMQRGDKVLDHALSLIA